MTDFESHPIDTTAKIDRLKRHIQKLKEIIARYGRHDIDCQNGSCTCGLKQAIYRGNDCED